MSRKTLINTSVSDNMEVKDTQETGRAFFNLSIRAKLLFATISILILTVVVTSSVNIIRFRLMYKEAILERARADAHDIRKGIDQGLSYFSLDSFSDMSPFLRRYLHENFSYAYIADINRTILYHTDPSLKGQNLTSEQYTRMSFDDDTRSQIISTDKFYEMVIPIISDFMVVGTVHIGIERDLVDSRVRTMVLQNSFILFIATILSIFTLYAFLAKNITTPITNLVEKVKDISRRFNLAIHKGRQESGNELKDFSMMFDTMAEDLREKTINLEQSNRELQLDIQQRELAERKLKESYKELRITFEGSIMALATAVESRDPYTAGHQQRVAQLACSIAKELNMDDSKIKEIYFSAMSHDIGKIGVPISILTKRGKLTTEEYGVIKTHPQVGYDILKEIEFPWPIATIVRQHHERLDGSGYPLGLKENDILWESKIIALSDVVEAIVSVRPYREALGNDAAMEEITTFRGSRYDPTVVDICLRLFHEKNFEFTFERKIKRPPDGQDIRNIMTLKNESKG